MTGCLNGKAALMTAAATGIGEATAHKFALAGANVLINGLPDDPIEEVAPVIIQQQGGKAIADKGDISQTQEAQIGCKR